MVENGVTFHTKNYFQQKKVLLKLIGIYIGKFRNLKILKGDYTSEMIVYNNDGEHLCSNNGKKYQARSKSNFRLQ